MESEIFDIRVVSGSSTLYVQSDRLVECIARYRRGDIDTLGINPGRGFSLTDLGFLRDIPDVKGLEVLFPPEGPYDLAPLKCLSRLRSLYLSDRVEGFSLTWFPQIESFSGTWTPTLGMRTRSELQSLVLGGFKPRTRDLCGDEWPPNLRDLTLVQPNIKSLLGLSAIRRLTRLEVAYARSLDDISAVTEAPKLEDLQFDRCGRITNHDCVRSLTALRSLRFTGCGSIADLRFLNEMPRLEDFRFAGTLIQSGDLTPLLRLKSVGFSAKKGYSHTPEQIDAHIADRARTK